MTTRTQQLAVAVTCLLSAMTYAGAVTIFGLAAFVLPGVVMAAALGSFLVDRHMFGAAFILGGLLVLAWSELVNVWSGNADGPAARATFVAAGCTLVAVIVAQSKSPALFLAAVAGSVCGALLLGAGGEVRIVAVATAAAAVLTLGLIESSRRHWTARSPRGAAFGWLPLLVGAVAAGAVLVQVHNEPKQPEAIGSGLAYPGIKPAWTDPLGTTVKTVSTPSTAEPNRSRPHPPLEPVVTKPPAPRSKSVSHRPYAQIVLLCVLVGTLLLVGALAVRFLAVRLRWARLRRGLAAGAVAEQITGAWTWTRLRLEACRLPLAAAVSPDIVAAGGAGTALPAEVFGPLQALATWTSAAAFGNDPRLAPADVAAAWKAARETETSARESLTRAARVRLALRGPGRRARIR